MAVEINPGTEMGITTRNKIPRRVQPSRRAASSSSIGTVWKIGRHHPDGIRQGKAHVGDDQHDGFVDQLQAGSNDKERDDQRYFRDHPRCQDAELNGAVEFEWNAHERIGRQAADYDTDDRYAEAILIEFSRETAKVRGTEDAARLGKKMSR